MVTLKRIEKIVQENAFDEKKKRPGLKFNPGMALIGLQTTGPWRIKQYIGNCLKEKGSVIPITKILIICYSTMGLVGSIQPLAKNQPDTVQTGGEIQAAFIL